MIVADAPVPGPRVGQALRRAARDFYEESWRLVLVNAALSAYVLVALAMAMSVPLALLLLAGAGPLLAALVRAAVVVVESGSLTYADVFDGLRRFWARGLVLGTSLALGVFASVVALLFYSDAGVLAWPLAVLVLYLGGIFALYQLVLWPLALREDAPPLREAAAEAGALLLRRPAAVTGLGLVLLVVNVLGIAAAVLPFLTITPAYSALAAARLALAPAPVEEAPWQA
jgi:hypothetical protein